MIEVGREQHEALADVQHILRTAGGVNRFGEPNYRAVWGASRLGWIAGKWTDYDDSGNLVREVIEARYVPKYAKPDRWYIERWLPPESYGSRESWYSQTIEREDGIEVAALGPYPERGEYEECFTIEDTAGKFVQLTPEMARWIALAIERSRAATSAERRAALTRREERKDRDYDAWAWDVLTDGMPAFHSDPFVTVL